MTNVLYQRFVETAERYADRPALEVDGRTLSYRALADQALAVAATLSAHRTDEGSPLTCVLGQRSVHGFVGILGALCSGHGYVPMLPTYPPARLAWMIERSESRALVVDASGRKVLEAVLDRVPQPLSVLVLDGPVDVAFRERFGHHRFVDASDLAPAATWSPPTVSADDIAYLLFTSGSTGEPKGVMVANRNITRFLDVVIERYRLGPQDRFSHMFDVTFDLSLFDLFGAWTSGGRLCCPDARQRMLPARYVVDADLTVWFSVPSTALLMKETRTLGPGVFPDLRLSLFCGEALTVPVARAWKEAAPQAVLENLYGPTELTLACTLHRFDPAEHAPDAADVVPIGHPFPGMEALVLDEDLREVAPGKTGELAMAGPQVALGYWRDPERTRKAFVRPPGRDEIFYRTGDRVRRPHDGEPLVFLGRLDQQIKIRGFRVELGEIEAAIREEASVDAAVALGWPTTTAGGAAGIVAFIDDASVDPSALQRRLASRLPRYMVPNRIRVIDAFPLNANGKIDRKALQALLSGSEPEAAS